MPSFFMDTRIAYVLAPLVAYEGATGFAVVLDVDAPAVAGNGLALGQCDAVSGRGPQALIAGCPSFFKTNWPLAHVKYALCAMQSIAFMFFILRLLCVFKLFISITAPANSHSPPFESVTTNTQ